MVPCLDFGCMLLVVVILASHVDLASSLEMRKLGSCLDPNPFISISHSAASPLVHHQNVTITINGVVFPSSLDWIAVVTPSNSDISTCLESKALYIATGDLASLPLLCHYPIKVEDGTLERKCFAARLAVEARLQKVAMTFVNVVQVVETLRVATKAEGAMNILPELLRFEKFLCLDLCHKQACVFV